MSTKSLYWVSLLGYFGLTSLLTLWITLLAPPETYPVSLLLLFCVTPLLAPLRGLLHGRLHTFGWTPLLMLVYFTHGVMEAYANPAARPLAGLEIFFASLVFISSTAYVRAWNREQRD